MSAVEHNVHYELVVIDAVKLRKIFQTTKARGPHRCIFCRFVHSLLFCPLVVTHFRPFVSIFRPPRNPALALISPDEMGKNEKSETPFGISARYYALLPKKLFLRFLHPFRHAHAHALREGSAEGPVGAEAALVGQLLYLDGLSGSDALLVVLDEIVDAQVVDISIIGDALTREILAEIGAVGANSLGRHIGRVCCILYRREQYSSIGIAYGSLAI